MTCKTMTEEIFDIYDAEMRKIGTAPRSKVHQEGYWHKTFQCWIVSKAFGNPKLLLQKRHETKDTFPGKLDKSAAGHLCTGETVEDAVRELEEELGVRMAFDKLTPIGIIPLESVTEQWKDREFCHVYMLEYDRRIEEYRVQLEEVRGLYWLDIEQYEDLIKQQRTKVTVQGIEWNDDGLPSRSEYIARLDDFTPQSESYYNLLFQRFKEKGFWK
jgi:isopentenyldiphosphate isomerase